MDRLRTSIFSQNLQYLADSVSESCDQLVHSKVVLRVNVDDEMVVSVTGDVQIPGAEQNTCAHKNKILIQTVRLPVSATSVTLDVVLPCESYA